MVEIPMSASSEQDRLDSVSRLNKGQLACLRLVMEGRTSKEIAKTTGISPHTVDQRLRIAIQTLGVDNRFEAARLVRQVEQDAYQSLIHAPLQRAAYQTPDVALADRHALPDGLFDDMHGSESLNIAGVAEEKRSRFDPLSAAFGTAFWSRSSQAGGRQNDLAPIVRLAWTVGLMIGVVLALSLLVTAAEGLARILEAAQL
ncbi:helix-turn-helix domain-containing protein [Sphingomonas qomolangmaensis]|uniref:Helix-turn-helix transcriptional regulator n=1 Tax=Sphingomonas qomolangmaensis TaxID=2918765 RepID=A0ABY5L994_9SPHN|nr:helix-turn-helix transcriptional regulator [Sphingomonas qomolangmaensis]UUL82335.1 helix-turn-helix transcriptional regulator [Sphingomonas qomolangmaensis]